MHRAMDIGMQAAEIGNPRRRPHAAEKAIALDQQGAPSRARRSHRRCDPGGSTAEDYDFIFAVQRHLPGGFFDGPRGQFGVPGWSVGNHASDEEFRLSRLRAPYKRKRDTRGAVASRGRLVESAISFVGP